MEQLTFKFMSDKPGVYDLLNNPKAIEPFIRIGMLELCKNQPYYVERGNKWEKFEVRWDKKWTKRNSLDVVKRYIDVLINSMGEWANKFDKDWCLGAINIYRIDAEEYDGLAIGVYYSE